MSAERDRLTAALLEWVAEDRGVELSYDQAREIVYGMPYDEWKQRHQTEATPEQKAAFERSHAKSG